MTAELLIERAAGGWVDRYRAYEVVVNGESRTKLRRGEVQKIEIDLDELEVYLRIAWCKSQAVQLSIYEGTRVQLICRPRSLLTVVYGLTFGRDNYIRLELA